MAIKVGESYVSEAALAYAKGKVNSDAEVTLKELINTYPDVNFSMNTAAFSQKGLNNVQIAPNILTEMKNDPEKRLEYEALIYDCAQLASSKTVNYSGNGFRTKASGIIINADGSLNSWSISESDNGKQIRNKTSLDRTKKETWADKILANQKKKRAEKKEKEKIAEKKAARKEEQEKLLDKIRNNNAEVLSSENKEKMIFGIDLKGIKIDCSI